MTPLADPVLSAEEFETLLEDDFLYEDAVQSIHRSHEALRTALAASEAEIERLTLPNIARDQMPMLYTAAVAERDAALAQADKLAEALLDIAGYGISKSQHGESIVSADVGRIAKEALASLRAERGPA